MPPPFRAADADHARGYERLRTQVLGCAVEDLEGLSIARRRGLTAWMKHRTRGRAPDPAPAPAGGTELINALLALIGWHYGKEQSRWVQSATG